MCEREKERERERCVCGLVYWIHATGNLFGLLINSKTYLRNMFNFGNGYRI
jgi:hypothetical protein